MCPHCKHTLGALDLVPVFSWLALGGKCRYCHKPISPQYPLVELLTAGLFVLSYVALKPVGNLGWFEFGIWLYVLGSLIALSVYDLRWMILPDVIVLPAILVAAIGLIPDLIINQHTHMWLGPILAAFALGGSFYALAAGSRGKWMGGGDIKLVFLIGLACGLKLSAVAMFWAFNIAAVVSLILIATGKRKRSDHIPFGPFLALGCVIAILWGHWLIDWYTQLTW